MTSGQVHKRGASLEVDSPKVGHVVYATLTPSAFSLAMP